MKQCMNCSNQIKYYASQSKGLYCSNKCQGQYQVKTKLKENTHFSTAMRKYVRDILFVDENCSVCNTGRTWNNQPLVLQIDHINGNPKDNRIENLRVICPNCHTQTSTWGQSNMSEEGRKRLCDAPRKSKASRKGLVV